MPKKYVCNECGNIFSEDLVRYLENGNQIFCERCGTPFSIMGVKMKKNKKIRQKQFTLSENIIKAKKVLIKINVMNLFLLLSIFVLLPCYLLIIWSGLLQSIFSFYLALIGVLIYFFIFCFGILEIIRGRKLFKNEVYQSKFLMINTIGSLLLRKILNSPSTEENKNEIITLKILINFMYGSFFLTIFHLSIPFLFLDFLFIDEIYIFIINIVGIFHFSIGYIILFRGKILRNRFLRVSSLIQLIPFNIILVVFSIHLFAVTPLFLFLDGFIIYSTIKIFLNKTILIKYISPKIHKNYDYGYKVEENRKSSSIISEELIKIENDLDSNQNNKEFQQVSSKKEILNQNISYEKKSKPEENEDKLNLKTLMDQLFQIDEKDKKVLKNYLLERFTVVSEKIRNSIDKLNISRKEKIDLLKDFVFLNYKEQQNLLDLLVHLFNK